MGRWTGLLGCTLALGLLLLPLRAQEAGRLPFASLGPDQGLPSGVIQTLAQDSTGFLWVGTETGLFRLEGDRCSRWTTEDGLPSSYINRLLPARQGGVWVSTLRGLVHFQDGRIETVPLRSEAADFGAGQIGLGPSGHLWVATKLGFYVQQEGLNFEFRPSDRAADLAAFTSGWRSGAVYVAGKKGITAFLPDGRTRHWGTAEGLPREGCSTLVEDGSGRLWAGIGRTLLAKEMDGDRFVDRSNLLSASLSANSHPLVDRDGTVWLPTQNGALHILGDRTERLDASGGLPFRWVRSLLRDAEGTLWIYGPALARVQGLGRIRNLSLSSGAHGEIFWFIHRDQSGRLIAGTDDGAAVIGTKGLVRIPGTEGRRIKGLASDRQGTLWMVSSTGPTLWLRSGQSQAEIAPLGEPGFSNNFVLADAQGEIWLGHATKGAFRWDAKAQKLKQELAPNPQWSSGLGVYHLRQDSLGRMWASTSLGLSIRTPQGRWLQFNESDGLPSPCTVYGSAFLPDGSAWIHFQEPHGLRRVRLEGDRLRVLEQRLRGPGLRSNMIYAIQVDGRGQTWATTDQGLDRLDPPLHLGQSDGLASEDCAVQALRVEKDRLWVGTAAGLVNLDLGGLDSESSLVQAHILDVAFGAKHLTAPFHFQAPVPSREATLSFRIGAPSYINDRDLRFQVRLLGLEDTWRDTDEHQIRYPALGGKAYRFEVRVAKGDAPFGPPSGLDFTVLPPWWQTWWAISLGSVAALLALIGVIRLREANLARSKADLELQVVKRTEELRARNEDLSAAIGRVKQLSGLLPICACCKKIRDDKGYWNQLEQYITDHSEVGFSHGICPDCAQELYPGFTGKGGNTPH